MKFTFLFALLAAFSLTGCFPYHFTYAPSVFGRVEDARTGLPVTAATVAFERPPAPMAPVRTAIDGCFLLTGEKHWALFIPGQLAIPPATLVVQAPGYSSARVPLAFSEDLIHLDTPIRLQATR